MSARTKRSIKPIRAAFARFFVVLYVIASLFAVLHQDHRTDSSGGHGPSSRQRVAGNSEKLRSAANSDLISASDRYCALCDFVSHMVSAATVPQGAQQLHAVLAGVVAPAVRPQPYAPFRFFARSASRAPPTV